MGLSVDIPGRGAVELAYLVVDVNGTLSRSGELIPGVRERLAQLAAHLEIHALSADTFGTLAAVTGELGIRARTVVTGDDKARHVVTLGAKRCVALGNGANDVPMLEAAELAIAVVGPEGAAGAALRAADVVCSSILDALDLLLDERALVATLRR